MTPGTFPIPANTFYCGPASGTKGLAVWRAIVAADVSGLSLSVFAAPSGDLSIGSHKLTNVTDPTAAQDAATKNYVDVAVANLVSKADCQAATTAALAASTYNNGSSGVGATITLAVAAVLVLDGYTPVLNDRLLVKNQAAPAQNGLYTVSVLGTVLINAVLTRATDFDQPAEVDGAITFIINGSTNGGTRWQCLASGTIVFGTTAINWSTFAGSTYTGDGSTISITGTTVSISATYAGQSTIVTVGTIATGVWQATVIGATYGGTGVNNGASTITLGGAFAMSGAFTFTGTLTANTAVTFPTTGTIGLQTNSNCQGRLTLTTGVPVTTTDVTAATSLYWTPYLGNRIDLWTGTVWVTLTFAELQLFLTTTGLVGGTNLTASSVYDIFAYISSGAVALDPPLAWTNGTTRATAVTYQDGVLCKSGDKTRRYLGTLYTTASAGQAEMSSTYLSLWNLYNQQQRQMHFFLAAVHNYTTATWREFNGGTSWTRLKFVVGLAQTFDGYLSNYRTVSSGQVDLGLDSTTALYQPPSATGDPFGLYNNSASQIQWAASSPIFAAAGLHYATAIEIGSGSTGSFDIAEISLGILC